MPKHAEKRELPHNADEMFDLVADVARYPQFLPWCAAARVRDRREIDPGVELIEADLVISFKVFREKFGSRVILKRNERLIQTEYIDGPFKYMRSNWRFRPIGEAHCEVDFDVDFEFRSKVLQAVIGVVFNQAMQRIVRAFEDRARALYGANAA